MVRPPMKTLIAAAVLLGGLFTGLLAWFSMEHQRARTARQAVRTAREELRTALSKQRRALGRMTDALKKAPSSSSFVLAQLADARMTIEEARATDEIREARKTAREAVLNFAAFAENQNLNNKLYQDALEQHDKRHEAFREALRSYNDAVDAYRQNRDRLAGRLLGFWLYAACPDSLDDPA